MRRLWALKLKRPSLFFGVTVLFVLLIAGAAGFDYIDEQDLAYAGSQPAVPPAGEVSIVVKVPQRVLELYSDGQVYKRYRIAVGKSDSPTPIGEWIVVTKDFSDKAIFGTRWLGLNVPWGSYGIHGTNRPWSIGQFASKGCIRLRNKDIEELFEWVPVGTKVRIEGPLGKVNRVLKYQMSGQDVVQLQLKLKKLGYYEGRADGLFGRTTQEAVRDFQREHEMEATGIADKKIIRMLGL